tara:strand:- start:68635 stop:69933 length:1299 start_codon:yes stop_codon:yes gene_type:complete
MTKISIFLLALFTLVSCKYGSNDGVKKPYKELINSLENKYEDSSAPSDKFRLDRAEEIKQIADDQIDHTNSAPTFVRKYYLFESDQNVKDRLNDMNTIVSTHINKCEATSLELQKKIHSVGKQQYQLSLDPSKQVAADRQVDSDIIVLHSLQYMKRMYETCAGLSFHYMNELSIEKYDEYEIIFKIREDLLRNFMGLSAMIKVIAKDSKTISDRILSAKEAGVLTSEQEELVANLAVDMKESTQKLQELTTETLKNGLSSEMQTAYTEMQEKADDLFKDKTILFDPANPDHPIVHVLVILSNLTWGSIQTSIGLGIVLTHAVVITPLSWILEPLFPMYFMKLRGPTLKIARNKMQIYADVCGFPAIPSKMSMGIFELDFCAGYSFASAHEGGHAKQSALLGPFYLPAAILSYALNMGHGGFIEEWADDWYVH